MRFYAVPRFLKSLLGAATKTYCAFENIIYPKPSTPLTPCFVVYVSKKGALNGSFLY